MQHALRYAISTLVGLGAPCAMALAGCSANAVPGVEDDEGVQLSEPLSSQTTNGGILLLASDPAGTAATLITGDAAKGIKVKDNQIVSTNPFFRSLGTNGRACVTCHDPSAGWTITPAFVQQNFKTFNPADMTTLHPLFRAVDGSNNPTPDCSTVDKCSASYSMLLTKGLIRVGIGIPANAEFELVNAVDPYNYASARELSLFRRPLPTANLRFLSGVMWDGRETFKTAGGDFQPVSFNLSNQANDATLGHAQALNALTADQRQQIMTFESSIYLAQKSLSGVGDALINECPGGPVPLSQQEFFLGINDPLGFNPKGTPFDPAAMTLFTAWTGNTEKNRASVARGQAIFNGTATSAADPSRKTTFTVRGVRGLNDDLGVSAIPNVSCTTCHDSPNVGDHSYPTPLDLGLTDASRRTSDMPLYVLRNINASDTANYKTIIQTTDPGRALITGKWKDIGRFKGPVLRGVGTHAPYFHNGSAATLADVVNFYDDRFGIGLTTSEKADLTKFLQAL